VQLLLGKLLFFVYLEGTNPLIHFAYSSSRLRCFDKMFLWSAIDFGSSR